MIHSSMKTTIDVAKQTRKFYMQAKLLLHNYIAMMMSSVHCFSHVVLICIVVSYNNNNNNNIYLKSNIHSIIRYKFSGLYNGIKHGIHIKTVQCI